ncbi:MAG: hypothetical protein IJQ02_16975 [Oscillospiraceae bacterium]|nr:hypothetical protein [Clostridia bacterium]MBR0162950.1 hypothetical protein [Oscillospiraceae bacterium]
MTHAINIRVSREKLNGGLLTCRSKTVRERLLRFLLGNPIKLTIIVPGDSVKEVGISGIPTPEQEALNETV